MEAARLARAAGHEGADSLLAHQEPLLRQLRDRPPDGDAADPVAPAERVLRRKLGAGCELAGEDLLAEILGHALVEGAGGGLGYEQIVQCRGLPFVMVPPIIIMSYEDGSNAPL